MIAGMLNLHIADGDDAEMKLKQAAGILFNLRMANVRCVVNEIRYWEARADEFLTELQEEANAVQNQQTVACP
jgi:hypothetical protein